MNSRYFTNAAALRAGQLASWDKYRELELQLKQNAVNEAGDLLEYETLELRIHPPNVRIDNEMFDDRTVLIIDSANRPGTLVEVVQCLTELGLSVKQARISSDGGWFVDEFHVSETPSGRVTDPKKLCAIKSVLSLPEQTGEGSDVHTVFQIAGPETPGVMAEITQLLSHNGLEIRTAAAWTYNNRAAIVLGVTEHNAAVRDSVKLYRLKQLLVKLVEKKGDAAVSVEQVDGPVHHERRLHQLLLADEIQAWKQLTRLQRQHSLPFPGPISTTPAAAVALAAADTDADIDQVPQTPKTPQHQWQRRMLPPAWTLDHKGKPVITDHDHHDEDVDGDEDGGQRQDHHQLSNMLGSASDTRDDPKFTAAADHNNLQQASPASPVTPEHSATAAVDQSSTANHETAVADAAAAQQASVNKLVALLQPPPLMHAISLPGPARQHKVNQQQYRLDHKPPATADAPAGTSSSEEQDQEALVDREVNSRITGREQQQQYAVAGLPPRVPNASVAAGTSSSSSSPIGPPTQHIITTSQAGSASAPNSPLAAKTPANTFASAAADQSPWATASAAAAAAAAGGSGGGGGGVTGQPSPRRFIRAGSTPAPETSSSSMFGLQQHLLHSSQAGHQVTDSLGSPDVHIQHSSLFNYWLVTIKCRDRNKLFYDTVCTLCDMRYDIYHATIDGEATGWASQLFYIRPRFGARDYDERRANVLKAMLVSAVQRRFPQGLRVHVFSGSTVYLQDLFNSMRQHGLTITRCKVRAYDNTSHTFYLLNQDGSLPSKQYIRQACQAAGGELVEAPLDVSNPCVAAVLRSLDARGRFAFSFVNKRHFNRLAAAQAAPEVAGAVPFHHLKGGRGRVGLDGHLLGSGQINDGGVYRGVVSMKHGTALTLVRDGGGRDQQKEGLTTSGSISSYAGSDQQPSF